MSPPRLVLVSGTSINLGKSSVTKGLSRLLLRRGKSVVGIKPVETERDTGAPGSEDGEALALATGQPEPRRALISLLPFGVPPLAAEIEGVSIEWEALLSQIKTYAEGYDVALVETMGGLCTPVTWDRDYLDLAVALDAPVLLMARDHMQGAASALLAMRAMRGSGARLLGLAFNVVDEPDPTTGHNEIVTRRATGFPRMTTIRSVKLRAPDGGPKDSDAFVEAVSQLEAVGKIADWILGAEAEPL